MALRFLADVTGWMVVSLTELAVTEGIDRESEFSLEQVVSEERARPLSVQVQDTNGHMDLELRKEGWVGDKDLGIDGIWEEAEKRGDEII